MQSESATKSKRIYAQTYVNKESSIKAQQHSTHIAELTSFVDRTKSRSEQNMWRGHYVSPVMTNALHGTELLREARI